MKLTKLQQAGAIRSSMWQTLGREMREVQGGESLLCRKALRLGRMFGAYSAGRYANIRRVLICQRVMAERLGLIAMSEEPEDTWIRDSVEQLIHKFREAKAKLFVPPKEKHWSDPLWDRVEMQWAIRDTRKAIEAKERRRQYDRARRARGRAQVMAARPTESTHLDTKRVTTAHKCIFKE